jgi:hypothetical protein
MTETLSPLRNSVLNFEFWSFEFVSDFEIRISDFLPYSMSKFFFTKASDSTIA